jgi:hypothetical protein
MHRGAIPARQPQRLFICFWYEEYLQRALMFDIQGTYIMCTYFDKRLVRHILSERHTLSVHMSTAPGAVDVHEYARCYPFLIGDFNATTRTDESALDCRCGLQIDLFSQFSILRQNNFIVLTGTISKSTECLNAVLVFGNLTTAHVLWRLQYQPAAVG